MKHYKSIVLLIVSIIILFSLSSCNLASRYGSVNEERKDNLLKIEYIDDGKTYSTTYCSRNDTHSLLNPIQEFRNGRYCYGWGLKDSEEAIKDPLLKEDLILYSLWKPICNYELSSDGTTYSVSSVDEGFKKMYSSTSFDGSDLICSYYNGLPVTEINDYAFQSIDIKKLVLPKTIKKVGKMAFARCGIEELDLSEVEYIDDSAFTTSKLNELVIPKSVKSLGKSCFWNCRISKLTIDADLKEIPSDCFEYNRIEEIDLPNSLETIGDFAFCQNNLKEITIPENVTEIGFYAFAENPYLMKVNFNEKVELIHDRAFQNTGLRVVVFPNSLKVLGSKVLDGSKVLKVVLGENIEVIDAFGNVPNLCDLYLPKSIDSITSFKKYYKRATIHYSNDEEKTYLESNDFAFKDGVLIDYLGNSKEIELPELEDLENPLITNYVLDDNLFKDNYNIEKVTVPGFVKVISKNNFINCKNLKEVILKEGITKVLSSFDGCESLIKLEIPNSIEFVSVNKSSISLPQYLKKVIYLGNQSNKHLVLLMADSIVENFIVHEDTKVIAEKAFLNTTYKEIVIPDSVYHINDSAFNGCYNLRKLTIGKNANGELVNDLRLLPKLLDIYNLSNIDLDGIDGVKVHKSIDEVSGAIVYQDYIFKKKSDTYYLVDYVGKEVSLKLPIGFTTGLDTINSYYILDEVFMNSNIEYVEIPKGVLGIGKALFKNSSKLLRVIIHAEITTLNDEAFYGCSNLESIHLPDTLEVIGKDQFSRCYNLCQINFPTSLKKLEEYAFFGCDSLTNVTLPKHLEEYASIAFDKHTKITYN